METDDIVTRLREFIRMGIAVGPFHAEQAANEIERLRAELQSYYDEDEEIRRGRSGE